MRNYPNSILVIEDAENIISARETTGSSAVADLLNITDGLLGDCLRVQIICTFNTDIRKIDQALLRNGRLIASYEFKELSVEKAQQLSIMLGQEKQITEPMTLSNIYNTDKFYFQRNKTKKSIGFNRV
jgi:ATP-dependent 26S proteasome regulatory subunit